MIKILSDATIRKIAAGEVIERPASIVKELVENSIDAKADDIIVEILEGGKKLIRVSDNGSGIAKDDIELAFTRHATSKIEDFDDLYKIYSMGFRGEALSSIIAAANLKIKTKIASDQLGNFVEYSDGKIRDSYQIAMNRGTIIEVSDLFSSIPVRKKFLKSDIGESNKITELMYSFAIANPTISFTYLRDNRQIFKTNKSNKEIENLEILFNKDFTDNILDFSAENKDYEIKGYISNTKFYKGNRSMQYFFVNNRLVENEELVSACEKAYEALIPNGRFPAFILFIEVDPNNIDINIHPNKKKIKFNFYDELLDLLKQSLIERLNESNREKEVNLQEEKKEIPNFFLNDDQDAYQRVLDAFHPPIKDINTEILTPSYEENFEVFENTDTFKVEYKNLDEFEEDNNLDNLVIELENKEQISYIEEDISVIYKTTIFNKYLLFEKNNSLIIVDKTSAFERIFYDNYKKSFENEESLSKQNLLSPILLRLSKMEMQSFYDNLEFFEKRAFDIEIFGNDSIILRAVPFNFMGQINEASFRGIFDDIIREKDPDKKEKYLLQSFMGKAINMDKLLNPKEAYKLYDDLMETSNPYQSPFGNTTIYKLDLETFKRILK